MEASKYFGVGGYEDDILKTIECLGQHFNGKEIIRQARRAATRRLK
jgi:hypothetical protein